MSVFLSGAKSRDWQPDEISQAVGDKRYGTPWSWRGLTRVCLGNLVKGQVTVTRYYLLRRPKLIIDFEPAPITGVKLFCEEKRRWAQNKGIVYVLIFLREKLTVDQLKARIDEETASMHRRAEERRLAEVVTSHPTPDRGTWRPQFEDPRVVEYIEQETLTRFAAEETVGKRYFGKQKWHRLRYHRQMVEEEVRRRIDDGSLGFEFRYREFESAERGRGVG